MTATNTFANDAPPFFGLLRVGEPLVVCRDVLVETSRPHAASPIVWRMVAAGTRGKLLGYRERAGEAPRAVVEVDGDAQRVIVLVRTQHLRSARTDA